MVASKMKLRIYQKRAVNRISKIYDFPCPVRAYCFVLPTGAGKSVIIGASVAELLKRNEDARILVCSWSRIIISQDKEKVKTFCGKNDVVFKTVQEMNCSNDGDVYDLIIVDECHKMYEGTAGYESIVKRMKNSNGKMRNPNSDTVILGFTATPYRNKHENVINESMFVGVDDIITYKELIDRNFLVPPEFIKGSMFQYDRDKLEGTSDFTALSMEKQCKRMLKVIAEMIKNIHESSAQNVRNHCTLVFLPSIRIVEEVAQRLKKMKMQVGVITGETEMEDREEIIVDAPIILNCATMTTGVDITRITSVVVCRATKSWVLWKQIIGRGLRLHDGKKSCYIIDCGGNVELFGESLDTMPSVTDAQVSGLPIMSECSKCHRYIATSVKTCPYCGNVIRTDEEIHASQLYKLYFDGGYRPVEKYSLERKRIPQKGWRYIMTIKMKVGRQERFTFSDHPFSKEKMIEYKDVLSHYKDEGKTLMIRVEKVNGFPAIVGAKLINLKLGL